MNDDDSGFRNADEGGDGRPDLEEIVAKLRKERDDFCDKHLRACADFDNARKRWDKERSDVMKFANFSLLRELTVVADEMEQALKMARTHTEMDKVIEGIDITYNNFMGILKKNGLVPIETKDKKFDPHLHEIVTSRCVDSDRDHCILEEVQRGYCYEGKVLRTSKVIVGVCNQTPDNRQQAADSKPGTADSGEREETTDAKEKEETGRKTEEGEEEKKTREEKDEQNEK